MILLSTAACDAVAAEYCDLMNDMHIQSGEWKAIHNIAQLLVTGEGILIESGGSDPYVHSPLYAIPQKTPLWLKMHIKTDRPGTAQIFYFSDGVKANESDSIRFAVRGEESLQLPLPAMSGPIRLRIDPLESPGNFIIKSMVVAPRLLPSSPTWPTTAIPQLKDHLALISGNVTLHHDRNKCSAFVISVDGKKMATGFLNPLLGYSIKSGSRWVNLAEVATSQIIKQGEKIICTSSFDDPDGGDWKIEQEFLPGKVSGTITVYMRVTVGVDRDVYTLPLLFLLPGNGTFGSAKGQALFAGLEYLDSADTSSSTADIKGEASYRQAPDTMKITIPLMALQHDDRYVGLAWDKNPEIAAIFDSPDRLFLSDGHLMGLIFPGSDGLNRPENSLIPYRARRLTANTELMLKSHIIGGQGNSVIPAVQKYFDIYGIPKVELSSFDWQKYLKNAAWGWLKSGIAHDGLYKHAYWPGQSSFPPKPAADAAFFIEWLADNMDDSGLVKELKDAAQTAIAKVRPDRYLASNISHITFPVAPLVFGHVNENADWVQQEGYKLVAQFEKDGSFHYKPEKGKPNFGSTHFAPDANGLTAKQVLTLLEYATFSGDPALLSQGVRFLMALNKFDKNVPRGAQTWEIPLHTPDLLASALLVRVYILGYEITGEPQYLERAIYWAWTGIPFINLSHRNFGKVDMFSTIAVYGATNWENRNWFGLPVQWCGLVYADALYRLLPYDKENTSLWKNVADGITVSGMDQTFQEESQADLRGLLPDSFSLRKQVRNGVAINPGTLQAVAAHLIGGVGLYSHRTIQGCELNIHAPGAISMTANGAEKGDIHFTVHGWPNRDYYVLVTGFLKRPRVLINDTEVSLATKHRYIEEKGRLILNVTGAPRITIIH